MGRRLIVILGAALALVAGCKKDVPNAPKRVIPVEVAIVAPQPVVDQMMIRAAIEPWQTVDLSAEVAGRLVVAATDEGQPVRKGEKLFVIDRTSYRAQLRQAEATAAYHRTYCKRCETLFAKKAISEDELDKARADRDAAEAAVEVAAAQLAKAEVFSPIDGVLDARPAEVGEFMNPGSPLATLVDIRRVKVVVPVPERDVVYVRPGQKMAVAIDALGGAETEGTVIFVKQASDPKTLTFPVHLEVANGEGRIRPGMIARVILVRHDFPQAVAVPLFAVIRNPDTEGYSVFVEAGGVARRREVTLGVFDLARVQVVEGLQVGDRLVVKGQRDLIDGDAVKVVSEGPAGAAAQPATGGGGADGGPDESEAARE